MERCCCYRSGGKFKLLEANPNFGNTDSLRKRSTKWPRVDPLKCARAFLLCRPACTRAFCDRKRHAHSIDQLAKVRAGHFAMPVGVQAGLFLSQKARVHAAGVGVRGINS
jgi:hypothetical protein